MTPSPRQQLRLFRVFGITVFLHWSWFLVAAYQLDQRSSGYRSLGWNLAEYLALFAVVLMHEFGHSLACRQVGGTANEIILWPLGGVAFVSPPPRPGAVLWSIAAGPLVNVVLVALLALGTWVSGWVGGISLSPSAFHFVRQLWFINIGLLIFNVLPIYPLDGGQILRALLWFPLGRTRSLWVASLVGVAGALGLVGLALWMQSFWTGIMAFFILSQCWNGFKEAKRLRRLESIPRHDGFACPSCHASPLQAALWICSNCQQPFDPFAGAGVCPSCSHSFAVASCPECRQAHAISAWTR
jgi:Zn-dependent protease/ribosomal protein L37AE/L43A